MNKNLFEDLYLGKWDSKGQDYPELKKEYAFHGIYSHQCQVCSRIFYGYKHRRNCLDCQQVIERGK